ncbi:MAG: hypothetical protein GY874_20795 [Desulfobacteraceae bacterium]|nr:hypothetical protein [Desulfobacteraceae bacterium]
MMRKKRITLLTALCLCLFLAAPAIGDQKIKLDDGRELIGFYGKPEKHLKKLKFSGDCDVRVYQETDGKPAQVNNDVYKAYDSTPFMVRNGCLYPYLGRLLLKDKKAIDFYQETSFNLFGILAFWAETIEKLPDGDYVLADGFRIKITDGRTQAGVEFCENALCEPDRD